MGCHRASSSLYQMGRDGGDEQDKCKAMARKIYEMYLGVIYELYTCGIRKLDEIKAWI